MILVNQTFEIRGLKSSSLFGKGSWYEVNYYSTVTGKKLLKQIRKTSIWGKIKPTFPASKEQDFAYKINYLGESKKRPE